MQKMCQCTCSKNQQSHPHQSVFPPEAGTQLPKTDGSWIFDGGGQAVTGYKQLTLMEISTIIWTVF